MIVKASFVSAHEVERQAVLASSRPIFVNTGSRAVGLDNGMGYKVYVLGTGPITVTTHPDELEDHDVKRRKVQLSRMELEAQAAGIRRIYEARRERERQRQRLRFIIEWSVVAVIIALGLWWLVASSAPQRPHPPSLDPVDVQEGVDR